MSESFRKTALSEKWTKKFGFHSKGSGQRMRNEEQSTQNIYSMHANGQDSVDLVAQRANCDKNRNSSKHWLESGESVDFLNAVEKKRVYFGADTHAYAKNINYTDF